MSNVENDLTKTASDTKIAVKTAFGTAEATITGLHVGPATLAIAIAVAAAVGVGAAVLFGW